MKRKFVLDENIIIFAERLTDSEGQPDRKSLKLVTDIIENCHTIVVDEDLERKYNRKFKELVSESKGRYSPVIIRLITQLRNAAPKYKYEIREYASRLSGEERIPDDDVGLIRLTVASGAIFVTTDSRLIETLITSGLQKRYSIQAYSPEIAVSYASPN